MTWKIMSHVQWDLLRKAAKAASQYDTQLLRVFEIKNGTCRFMHDTKTEEEVALLKKRKSIAKYAILALNREVKVLEKFYDFSKRNGESDMIYDFLDSVNNFCYTAEEKNA